MSERVAKKKRASNTASSLEGLDLSGPEECQTNARSVSLNAQLIYNCSLPGFPVIVDLSAVKNSHGYLKAITKRSQQRI